MATSLSTQQSRTWNAIYDAAILDGLDEALARDEADAVCRAVAEGRKYDREAERRRRRAARAEWGRRIASVLGLFLLVCAIAAGILAIVWSMTNGYAGLDQEDVIRHSTYAVNSWYGENDRPKELFVVAKEKSRHFGRDAWKVVYRKPTGQLVCVFVWDAHQEGGGRAVIEKGCHV